MIAIRDLRRSISPPDLPHRRPGSGRESSQGLTRIQRTSLSEFSPRPGRLWNAADSTCTLPVAADW